MKQADGIAITPSLSVRTSLSSHVVVTVALLPVQGYSASAATMGTVPASTVSVYVLQYSNVISVI